MSPSRWRYFALVSLVPLLGCLGDLCGSEFTPPELAECETADEEHTFDAIEVAAQRTLGGQGSEMLVFTVTYLGADPPTCADIGWTAVQVATGDVVASGSERIETVATEGGRITASELWQFWPSTSGDVRVNVTSHGQTGSDLICNGDCVDPDGGLDAGADDAGADDAGP